MIATDVRMPLPAGWSLRAARDADADALLTLVGGVFAEYEGCVLEPDGLDADLGAWGTYLSGLGGAGWVVVDETDRVVACVGVAPLRADAGQDSAMTPLGQRSVELKRLYVASSARRRGLGAALVELVEGWAIAHGRDRVELWSDTRFEDAHRLYSRTGYTATGDERELLDTSNTTELRFERELP